MERDSVTHSATDRRLGRLPSGTDVATTVHRYDGGPGPTVYVQAAQHGIELNGAAVLRRLHDRLLGAEIAGTVQTVPVVNALALDQRTYITPPEFDVKNPNLNRVWPGDREGSLTERMAARLWDLIEDADAVVDLHTGSPDMLEHVRFPADDPTAEDLASAFGTAYRLTDTADEGGGTLRAAATDAAIPAITAELGNSRQVSHGAVRTGLDGVVNVLREFGVVPGGPGPSPDQTVLRDADDHPVADTSGLFEPRPDLGVGDRVDAGEELGAVYCPSTFERRDTVLAEGGGVVYSLTRESVVVAGERLAAVAPPE